MNARFKKYSPAQPPLAPLDARLRRAKARQNFPSPQAAEHGRSLAAMNAGILAEQRTIIRNLALDSLQSDPGTDATRAAARTLAALDDWLTFLRAEDRARPPSAPVPPESRCNAASFICGVRRGLPESNHTP
ncbi:MAG: hypothetical protein WCS31_01920 [Verrucomicrobiae bacterium]